MSIESRSRQYGKVFDHWQIREFLGDGSGGKSAVFRLVHTESSTVYSALKIISLIERRGKVEMLSDSRKAEYERAKKMCKENAEQEVLLMNGLQGHSNIVGYLDHTFVDWEDESGYGYDMLIRMELLQDLRGQIESEHYFSQDEVVKIGQDICNALVLCHQKKFYHRDIKPENIFYNKDGNYKLGDFGISKIMSSTPGAKSSTRAYTEEYAAPEQIFGKYDNRVDIYSLGLVLYELSNDGLLPFAASSYITEYETQERLLGKPLPVPKKASKAFATVILKACAYDPDDRYQTAEEFLAELNYLAGVGSRPARKAPEPATGRTTQKANQSRDRNATQYARSDSTPRTSGRRTAYPETHQMPNAERNEPAPRRSKGPKGVVIAGALLLVIGIIIVAVFGSNTAADKKEIAEIIDTANVLCNDKNYGEAIAKIEEGLDEYPRSDELERKLNEIIKLQTDSNIVAIIADAEKYASDGDYETAITALEDGLSSYPESTDLQSKMAEYSEVLSAEIRTRTLEDAQDFVDIGDYESAMSLIKAAQEAYGTSKEYDVAYATYFKAYSLQKAADFADSGDYAGAVRLLADAQNTITNDVELISAYNSYCDIYVANVSAEADSYYDSRQMNEAIAVLDAALKVVPSNSILEKKKAELNENKPVPLSSVDVFNGGWEWNNLTPIDPFGNDFSSASNYVIFSDYYGNILPQEGFISREVEGYRQVFAEYNPAGKYNVLSMRLAPYSTICQDGNAFVQVFADSELVYTSPTITRKTEAFTCEVDISGAQYIEILVSVYIGGVIEGNDEGAIIIADAQMWP